MERLLSRLLPSLALASLLLANQAWAVYSTSIDTELPAATQINANNQSAPTAPGVYAYQMCFNGTNWDRCSGSAVDTELPTPVTLADNMANFTVPVVGAAMLCFDGTTWDRCLPGVSDTDDNSVAFSQVTSVVIDFAHMSDGSKWIRMFGDPTNGLTIDQANTAQTDYDTGAGTVLQTMIGIALPASGGPVAGGTATNPLVMSGSMTCSNCSGTGVSVNEDVASANADPGTPAYSVRQSTLSTTTSADGDYQPLKSNDNGELYTSTAIRGAIPTGANVIGALLANQSINLNQFAGSSIQQATNTMNTSGGGLPVTALACQLDATSPTATTENQFGNVRCSSIGEVFGVIRDAAGNARGANVNASNELQVAITANSAINVAQINGVTPLMGAGNTGTGSPRVTVATDQAAVAGFGIYVEDAAETAGGNLSMSGSVRRSAAASSAGSNGDNATINTDDLGLLWVRHLDPCNGTAKTPVPININTATTTQLVAASASNFLYVCSLNIGPTAGAQNIALIEDDTSACASPTAGMAGGTTAATGWNISTNGGLMLGDGNGTVAKTASTNRYVCLITSAAVQTSGVLMYALAP